MAQLISVKLSRYDNSPWGFRLQGGKDFGTPLIIQKVNGGSPAEKAGLQAGDAVLRINNIDATALRHKDAQDCIVRAGNNYELAIQRGGIGMSTWKPAVAPVGPSPVKPNAGGPVTKTSLAYKGPAPQPIGTGHNTSAKPFGTIPHMNGGPDKQIVNKQFNSPIGIYSEQAIAETLSAQAEVLTGGAIGVNFKKNEKEYNSANSEVLKMVQEADKEPRIPEPDPQVISGSLPTPVPGGVPTPFGVHGLRHVQAPEPKAPGSAPAQDPFKVLPPGQNICADCERLIVGVFVRIKDKNLHVECFKCATCGTPLKNVGYYNLNHKLYCDIHAKMVARQNPPAPNLDPVTVPPGARPPAGTISNALAGLGVTAGPPAAAPLSPSGGLSPQPGIGGPLPFHSGPCPLPASSAATSVTAGPVPAPLQPHSSDKALAQALACLEQELENQLKELSLPTTALEPLSVEELTIQPTAQAAHHAAVPVFVHKAPRVGTSHVNAPKPQTPSSISGPRPFGSPIAPSAPAPVSAPLPSNSFGRPATGFSPSAGYTPSSVFAPSSGFAPSATPSGLASTLKPLTKLRGGPGGAKGGAFAGASAPIRGRGILNPAAIGGTRVPLCGACNQQIRGPFITALGKIWCPHHFTCSNSKCQRPLQDIGFVEEKGMLYCEYCFEQFIAPPCDKCGHKIKGDCLNAIGKHFHPECFNCVYCGKLFGNSPFFLEDGQPYCENDWNELFTTKCFACGFPIEAGDRWVEALSNNYHSQCFNCSMCKKNLEGQSFFAKGGRPFCKNHAR
ncbi:PDZ and LIM domain protein Zasp isoform X2 [Frankliniella occidentalis]|uniref:PDZ and LIM domain protein Zasp isoform X2 n=1 Tax=Frankliniella occidentalis TaxID=133901 RepID=A0A9C6XU38_FRAOC|nr:PDZ and LIM domain protein Zasp isoform X2 [Frankliniella occidentalis]